MRLAPSPPTGAGECGTHVHDPLCTQASHVKQVQREAEGHGSSPRARLHGVKQVVDGPRRYGVATEFILQRGQKLQTGRGEAAHAHENRMGRERTGGTPTTARLTPRPGAALSFTARRNCHAGGTPIAVTATRNSSSFSSPSPSGREREGGCESECVSDSTGGEASPPSRKLNTDVSTDTWASSRPDVEERGVGGGNTGGAAFTGALA